MQDAFKNLTPQQVARLLQYAEGTTGGDAFVDGGVLHAEKNAPWVNGQYSNIRFPAYVYQPYPKWLFNASWLKLDEQWRNALALRGRRGGDPDERERIIFDAATARAAAMQLVQGPEEERLLGSLWCETPALAVEAQEKSDRAIAQAAAESNWDDRRMSPAAQAEREALDAASETHLTDVPRTPLAPRRDPISHRKKSHHKKKPARPESPAAEPTEVTS